MAGTAMAGPAMAGTALRGPETSDGSTSTVDYLVPIDPMDELHCESCQ